MPQALGAGALLVAPAKLCWIFMVTRGRITARSTRVQQRVARSEINTGLTGIWHWITPDAGENSDVDLVRDLSLSFTESFFEPNLSLQKPKRSAVCASNEIQYFVLECGISGGPRTKDRENQLKIAVICYFLHHKTDLRRNSNHFRKIP